MYITWPASVEYVKICFITKTITTTNYSWTFMSYGLKGLDRENHMRFVSFPWYIYIYIYILCCFEARDIYILYIYIYIYMYTCIYCVALKPAYMSDPPKTCQLKQDCFLQKEARVCVSTAFVIEESKFKLCFFVVEDEQVTEEADMLMWI